jgi:transcriptional regulator with XRE-family HTH domain
VRQSSAHRQHPLAVRLRKLRAERSLTLREVAERAGMCVGHVSVLELGHRLPSIDSLVRLARSLSCKVSDIISCLDEADTTHASDREAKALGGVAADREDAR